MQELVGQYITLERSGAGGGGGWVPVRGKMMDTYFVRFVAWNMVLLSETG